MPFLVLAKACHDMQPPSGGAAGSSCAGGGSEHQRRVYGEVLATCLAVYRSRLRRLRSELFGEAATGGEAGASAAGAAQEAGAGIGAAAAGGADAQAGPPPVAAAADPAPLRRQPLFLEGGPAARTLDVVPSLEVLLMRLLCAAHYGDLALAEGEDRGFAVSALE